MIKIKNKLFAVISSSDHLEYIVGLFFLSIIDCKIVLLNIGSLNDTTFKFIFKPQSYDVVATRQNLITIPDELITINIIVDNISSGNSAGGTSHIFTSSRS